ncbi:MULTISPECIES: ImmA/IrrE family metallo-endopeptidase [unclassified Virgibacillus]|uniref:ImmA/IrrE family metallo-endopeptidase n=1 Tax=unclassified Virgibacillus TaxID=2620237 RepID=UPI00090A2A1D|nr:MULTISPECIES: ImmA/IrrE family metallo-endopeptidase [unclassified Virgibacillus]API92465.1 terminase [Virgibacillus sp. 6R]
MYTHLEDYIYELYTSIGIKNPADLDKQIIAKKLGVDIIYEEDKLFRFDNEISLIRNTERQEWMDFGHEIGHYLRHCGCQLNMHPLFIDLQEWQANNFAYHFCVPTFMLDKLYNYKIFDIMQLVNVDYDFVYRRLEMYTNKMRTGGFFDEGYLTRA